MRIFSLFLLFFPSMLFGSAIVFGPVQISPFPNNNNSIPQVVVDPLGNALAIWVAGFPLVRNQIQTARFDAATGAWSMFFVLDEGATPQISVDNFGNAIAIWIAFPANQINVSRFDVGTLTWSQPVQISQQITPNNSPEVNFSPQIAVDSAGNAIAVWVNSSPNLRQVLASCFDTNATSFALGWTPQFRISINTNSADFPQISMDNAVNDREGVAVWVDLITGAIEAANILIP